MTMFRRGDFTFVSGKKGKVKIEVPEGATEEDLESWAFIIASDTKFGSVEGVPTGGLPLADKLQQYVTPENSVHLIVDDVYTTGGSIYKLIDQRIKEMPNRIVFGYVVFQRSGHLGVNVRAIWEAGIPIP